MPKAMLLSLLLNRKTWIAAGTLITAATGYSLSPEVRQAVREILTVVGIA